MNPYPDIPHAGPGPRSFSSDHLPVQLDEYYGDATDPIGGYMRLSSTTASSYSRADLRFFLANPFVFPLKHEPYYFRDITQDGYKDCVKQDAISLRLQRPENEMNYFQNDYEFCKPPLAALREHQRYFGHVPTDHTPPESMSDRKEYVYPSHLRRPHGENISYEEEEGYAQTGSLPHGQTQHRSRLRPVSELRSIFFST